MQQSHNLIGWKDTKGLPTTSRARAIEMFAMVEVDWTVELFWKVSYFHVGAFIDNHALDLVYMRNIIHN